MRGSINADTYWIDLAKELAQTPHGQRGRKVKAAATLWGISEQSARRRLRAGGYRTGRKRRCDAGSTSVSKKDCQVVANMIVGADSATGLRRMPATTAVEIAKANGLLESDVSPATILRQMRRAGHHPEQLRRPSPFRTMRSRHPNHTWQFDVSLCVLFYLDKGGVGMMDEKRFYKNKPQNAARVANHRVLRYLITDHATGAFFLRYYQAAGEDQETLFEFLMEAFAAKGHEKDPFHGVPFNLVWDAGSANQSFLIKNLLDQLGVRHWPHIPGNPRAKGQVESGHWLVERQFESRLSLTRIDDIDTLNEHADEWRRYFNGTKRHRRTNATRYGQWQTIREEELRIAPQRSVCEELLHTKPELRKVTGNWQVSYRVRGFERCFYDVSHVPGIRPGEKVSVCVNPYHAPAINVIVEDDEGRAQFHRCEPVQLDRHGFPIDAPVIGEQYASANESDISRNRKAAERAAFGADTNEQVEKAKRDRQPVYGGDVDPFSYLGANTPATFMQRPGTELDLPSRTEIEAKPLGLVEALSQISRMLGRPLSMEENRSIRERYPDGLPEIDLPAVVARLEGTDARQAIPALQVVK